MPNSRVLLIGVAALLGLASSPVSAAVAPSAVGGGPLLAGAQAEVRLHLAQRDSRPQRPDPRLGERPPRGNPGGTPQSAVRDGPRDPRPNCMANPRDARCR